MHRGAHLEGVDAVELTDSSDSIIPQLIVRDVPPDVARALKQRAARNGRSAEAEHRILLRDALQAELEARSFKALLISMPDVGSDADFAPPRDLPRELA